MANIVFIGNSQAGMLRLLYQKYVVPYAPANTVHIWSNRKLSEASRTVLSKADVIVRQVQDFETEANLTDLPSDAFTHLLPAVVGGFLWPFGGRAHPLNATVKQDADGPYPGQLGDSYLNGLIAKNVAPEEAVRQYLALDVNSVVNLDRLYRIVMSRQRRMDTATGFNVADVIENHFRTESTFLTAYHPDWRIMGHLADVLFQRMGVRADIVERMRKYQTHNITPPTQLPIHPAVAAHFGLLFIRPDHKYRYRNEGSFAFAQWAERYMRFEWNAPLEAGIKLTFNKKDDQAARAKLVEGLARSPNAAPGWRSYCQLLMRLGERESAAIALAKAMELDPNNPTSHAIAGAFALHDKRHDQAEAAYRRSIELLPNQSATYRSLAGILARRNKSDEAIDAYRMAVDLNPRDALAAIQLARLLAKSDRPEAATATVAAALEHNPEHLGLRDLQAQFAPPGPADGAVEGIGQPVAGAGSGDQARQ